MMALQFRNGEPRRPLQRNCPFAALGFTRAGFKIRSRRREEAESIGFSRKSASSRRRLLPKSILETTSTVFSPSALHLSPTARY
jgi:hypothetical protein